MRTATALRATALIALATIPIAVASGCSPAAQAGVAAPIATSTATAPVIDQPLETFQSDLLEVAFRAASAMPLHPHAKNRSRVQESVVQACFDLDQPLRALDCIGKIADWRRGAGYADFAYYCARHGDRSQVDRYLSLAKDAAAAAESRGEDDTEAQDWRRDRIRSKIARACLALGRASEAAEFLQGLVDSEAGRVEGLQATLDAEESFEAQLARLAATTKSGNFDQLRNALETGAGLFARDYDKTERRDALERMLEAGWTKLPPQIRLDVQFELIEAALAHEDQVKARELVSKSQAAIEGAVWTAESGIPVRARLAGLRSRAGDAARARADADGALALFDARREEIVNIYRGGVLRAVAEAYRALGDSAAAASVYARAVEAGVENPNSRPRAEDLAATCCSMAKQRVEPDAKLRARIREICEGLKDPW